MGLSRCAGVVCPGMGFAWRVRHAPSCVFVFAWTGAVGLCGYAGIGGGVMAVVSGYKEKGGGTCGVPSL